MSESEYRKIAGIKTDAARPVNNPSIGPSIPTAVISKHGVYDVKEIQVDFPNQPGQQQFMVANLVISGSSSSSTSTTIDPETEQSNQDQEEDNDGDDYLNDEMIEEFGNDEASGQGGGDFDEGFQGLPVLNRTGIMMDKSGNGDVIGNEI